MSTLLSKLRKRFDYGWLDSLALGALIVLMCSQLNLGDIGKDTTAQGYVTKQLKIALPDIALLFTFVWFSLRTTLLRAWRKIWWPPFPCWALVFVMLLSMARSRPLVDAIASNLEDVHGFKAMLRALITKESKEAIAETIQFTGYFLLAPLVFVNLIHDRRQVALVSRRHMAICTFLAALIAVCALSFAQKSDLGHQGPFGSPYALSAFLSIAGALLAARLFWPLTAAQQRITAATLVVGLLLMSSIWAVVALVLGIAVIAFTKHTVPRALAISSVVLAIAACSLFVLPSSKLRSESMQLGSKTELVKKQYVEWLVAATRLADSREASFATGVGPGNYQFNIGAYYARLPNEEKMPPDSNNLYLVQAVNIGVLGLGVLLWIVLHFGGVALAAVRRFPNDWLATGVLGSLAAWIFVSCFHATIVRGTGVVFAFVLSLAVIAAEHNRNDSDPLLSDSPSHSLPEE